jgi:hypothetical protein
MWIVFPQDRAIILKNLKKIPAASIFFYDFVIRYINTHFIKEFGKFEILEPCKKIKTAPPLGQGHLGKYPLGLAQGTPLFSARWF